MTELEIFNIIALSFLALGAAILILLLFITAPYGRYSRKGWGPMVNPRLSWMLMEFPASLLMIIFLITSTKEITITLLVFVVIWEYHYLYRTLIYPATLKESRAVPASIIVFSIIFNGANGYLQGAWLFSISPETAYTAQWLTDPRFIIGTLIFAAGIAINRHADAKLQSLKNENKGGYGIPRGGLYGWISCPNYFGEIIQWLGWAMLTWSLAGAVFAFWTIANLAPRALAHHKWYKKTFPDYPENKKALIPGIL